MTRNRTKAKETAEDRIVKAKEIFDPIDTHFADKFKVKPAAEAAQRKALKDLLAAKKLPRSNKKRLTLLIATAKVAFDAQSYKGWDWGPAPPEVSALMDMVRDSKKMAEDAAKGNKKHKLDCTQSPQPYECSPAGVNAKKIKGHQCTSGHHYRPGDTSEQKCLAMNGCAYDGPTTADKDTDLCRKQTKREERYFSRHGSNKHNPASMKANKGTERRTVADVVKDIVVAAIHAKTATLLSHGGVELPGATDLAAEAASAVAQLLLSPLDTLSAGLSESFVMKDTEIEAYRPDSMLDYINGDDQIYIRATSYFDDESMIKHATLLYAGGKWVDEEDEDNLENGDVFIIAVALNPKRILQVVHNLLGMDVGAIFPSLKLLDFGIIKGFLTSIPFLNAPPFPISKPGLKNSEYMFPDYLPANVDLPAPFNGRDDSARTAPIFVGSFNLAGPDVKCSDVICFLLKPISDLIGNPTVEISIGDGTTTMNELKIHTGEFWFSKKVGLNKLQLGVKSWADQLEVEAIGQLLFCISNCDEVPDEHGNPTYKHNLIFGLQLVFATSLKETAITVNGWMRGWVALPAPLNFIHVGDLILGGTITSTVAGSSLTALTFGGTICLSNPDPGIGGCQGDSGFMATGETPKDRKAITGQLYAGINANDPSANFLYFRTTGVTVGNILSVAGMDDPSGFPQPLLESGWDLAAISYAPEGVDADIADGFLNEVITIPDGFMVNGTFNIFGWGATAYAATDGGFIEMSIEINPVNWLGGMMVIQRSKTDSKRGMFMKMYAGFEGHFVWGNGDWCGSFFCLKGAGFMVIAVLGIESSFAVDVTPTKMKFEATGIPMLGGLLLGDVLLETELTTNPSAHVHLALKTQDILTKVCQAVLKLVGGIYDAFNLIIDIVRPFVKMAEKWVKEVLNVLIDPIRVISNQLESFYFLMRTPFDMAAREVEKIGYGCKIDVEMQDGGKMNKGATEGMASELKKTVAAEAKLAKCVPCVAKFRKQPYMLQPDKACLMCKNERKCSDEQCKKNNECANGHDGPCGGKGRTDCRTGKTSHDRCVAMTGCAYDSTSNHCFMEAQQSKDKLLLLSVNESSTEASWMNDQMKLEDIEENPEDREHLRLMILDYRSRDPFKAERMASQSKFLQTSAEEEWGPVGDYAEKAAKAAAELAKKVAAKALCLVAKIALKLVWFTFKPIRILYYAMRGIHYMLKAINPIAIITAILDGIQFAVKKAFGFMEPFLASLKDGDAANALAEFVGVMMKVFSIQQLDADVVLAPGVLRLGMNATFTIFGAPVEFGFDVELVGFFESLISKILSKIMRKLLVFLEPMEKYVYGARDAMEDLYDETLGKFEKEINTAKKWMEDVGALF